jgi:hypothetical protein
VFHVEFGELGSNCLSFRMSAPFDSADLWPVLPSARGLLGPARLGPSFVDLTSLAGLRRRCEIGSILRRPSTEARRWRIAWLPEPVTPYQKAAQVWDERIGSARVQAKKLALDGVRLLHAIGRSRRWTCLAIGAGVDQARRALRP